MTETPENPNPESITVAEEKMLLLNAAKARQKLTRYNKQQRENVAPEQYVDRLNEAMRRDASLFNTVRESKIEESVVKWAKMIGNTFAEATTELPQVSDRLYRLENKQGLHKTSIVFSGQELGRGKTWQSYAYLNQIIKKGVGFPGQISYGTEGSTVSYIATSGFERAENMREFLRDSHRFFFIDDVGQGYYFKEESRHDVWYELVDHVYRKQLTLILTTNLAFTESGPQSLGGWMGRRAFDRLKSLVGDDGHVLMAGVNKREQVFRENEETFAKKATKTQR